MKKLLCIALILCMALTLVPFGALAADTSGSCGANVKWSLDSSGVLTISGSGPMDNYDWGAPSPSYPTDGVKELVVLPGVTTIGDVSFCEMKELEKVTLPNTLTRIGQDAFCDDTALKTVTIYEGVSEIAGGAFESSGLESIYLPASLKSVDKAGIYTRTLKDIYYAGSAAQWSKIELDDASAYLIQDGTAKVHYNVKPGAPVVPEGPFADVPLGAYFTEPVTWAVDKEITSGVGNNRFAPNRNCTRAQIVTFLWRAKNCPEPESKENPFVDVKPDDYFFKAVLWAVENEITAGTGNGKFTPGGVCTRAQAVTFLWRSEGKPEAKSDKSEFSDVQSSEDYFFIPVLWAVENEITAGTGNGKFTPGGVCTRAQIVTFLWRDLAE